MKNKQPMEPAHAALDRETKILNILTNTSILLMSFITETCSEVFTQIATEMATAVSTGLGAQDETKKDILENLKPMETGLPKQMREQMIALKTDLSKQLHDKKKDITQMIADPKFDEGIRIAETYDLNLPYLTQDLDEITLLQYIALLKTNHPECTKMVQELLEWMKSVPQPQ